jgi:quaternary ammonium compound-resistance protein SugE
MAWVLVLIAGLLKILWAYTMKLSQGFTRGGPTLITLLARLASFGLLSISMKSLPLGTATRCGPASARSVPSRSASRFWASR